MRKWEYIANALKYKNAPKKVINAAEEIDNILVSIGFGWDTEDWELYEGSPENESWTDIGRLVNDRSCCPACYDCYNNCPDCILGNEEGCTPRSKYADNYFHIVNEYVRNRIDSIQNK